MTTGIQQESILGPLLFLIYMNDMVCVSEAFKFTLHSDNTALFTTIKYSIPARISNIDESLNNELSYVLSI